MLELVDVDAQLNGEAPAPPVDLERSREQVADDDLPPPAALRPAKRELERALAFV